MRPNLAVGTPSAFLVCVAAGLADVGTGIWVRLNTLKNSTRTWKLILSRMRKVLPKFNCSFGIRA
jgi:hypothetical protein